MLLIYFILSFLVLNEIEEKSIVVSKIEYENSKLNKSNIILLIGLGF